MVSNIRKFFLYKLTTRRNFLPILSIYFMTFPNNTIRQLWIFTAIGTALWFLLEVPSWYLADRLWHKKTLILAKFGFLFSTICFLIGWNRWVFMLGSIFMSIWFSFNSGTVDALFYETLEEVWEEKQFTKINSRISGNVSLVSVIFIILLPILTEFSYRMPILVFLLMDVFGIIITLSLHQPLKTIQVQSKKTILQVAKSLKWKNIYIVIAFTAVLWGALASTNPFRWVYVESLGYPVALIGLVMWMSRVVWFGVSRIVHWIENRFSLLQLFFWETFLFGLWLWWVASFDNPYLVWAILSLLVGYFWWRSSIISNYIIKRSDKNYKATILSIKSLFWAGINFLGLLILGFVIDFGGFRFGFACVAIFLFVGLMTILLIWKNKIR